MKNFLGVRIGNTLRKTTTPFRISCGDNRFGLVESPDCLENDTIFEDLEEARESRRTF